MAISRAHGTREGAASLTYIRGFPVKPLEEGMMVEIRRAALDGLREIGSGISIASLLTTPGCPEE